MIVCKFGGTSLDDGRGFADRVPVVEERAPDGCLVLASAMAGVSRELLRMGWLAESGASGEADEARRLLVERHRQVLTDAGVDGSDRIEAERSTDHESERLRSLLATVAAGWLEDRTRDRILATGELLSSRLLATVLRSRGIAAVWIDPRRLVVSDERFGEARPDWNETRKAARHLVTPHLARETVVVTGGFVGCSPGGATTTLGWGASDMSATLLGSVLDAPLIEIWTDVDGISTTDPRLVPGARPIPELSYEEAIELAFFGAQVLHHSAIPPARRTGAAIRVRNSFRPEVPGTLVCSADRLGRRPEAVRGVALAGPISRASLPPKAPCGLDGSNGGPPWAVVAGRTIPGCDPGTADGVAVLAAVGQAVGSNPPLLEEASALLAAVAAERSQSPCDSHLAFVVPAAEGPNALRSLHDAFCREAGG